MKRRHFLFGFIPLAALAATLLPRQFPRGETQALLTDPDEAEFVYRGGWIVRR